MSNCPSCGTQSLSDSQFCHKCGCNLAGETGKLDPDTVLENRYVIVKTLGKGGMGAVYQALDLRLNNIPVAIKEMSTRAVGTGNLQGAIAAFKKEAAMLISLRHPALPRINDFFSRGEDRWYLVMDYIEGETLAETVKRRGRIPQEKVLDWGIQLCEILDYLHGQKPPVIFRDLKPSNIMVTPQGKIKLIDFGIARHFKAGSSVDTSAYGSTGYAPPEQYGENQTDPRSDIYALGAVLHFLLTEKDPSKNPFTFEPPGEILPAPVSPALEAALIKALSLKPGDRPGSAKEMLELLKEDSSDIAGRTETIPIAKPVTEEEPEDIRAVKQESEQILTETLKVQQNNETIGILGLGKPESAGIQPDATVGMDKLGEVAAGSLQKAVLQKYSKENLYQYTVQPQKVYKTGSMRWILVAVGIIAILILGEQWFNHLKNNGEGSGDKSYQTSSGPNQNNQETEQEPKESIRAVLQGKQDQQNFEIPNQGKHDSSQSLNIKENQRQEQAKVVEREVTHQSEYGTTVYVNNYQEIPIKSPMFFGPIYIKENTPGSLLGGRTINFKFPAGTYINTPIHNVVEGDIKLGVRSISNNADSAEVVFGIKSESTKSSTISFCFNGLVLSSGHEGDLNVIVDGTSGAAGKLSLGRVFIILDE